MLKRHLKIFCYEKDLKPLWNVAYQKYLLLTVITSIKMKLFEKSIFLTLKSSFMTTLWTQEWVNYCIKREKHLYYLCWHFIELLFYRVEMTGSFAFLQPFSVFANCNLKTKLPCYNVLSNTIFWLWKSVKEKQNKNIFCSKINHFLFFFFLHFDVIPETERENQPLINPTRTYCGSTRCNTE